MTPEEIVIPGLVDMHVHLREPGATHKEDFSSGTKAALAGGITAVFDMPNNPDPYRVTTHEILSHKRSLAAWRSHTDIGFYYESQLETDNTGSFNAVRAIVHGLKLYLEPTTGNETEYDPANFKEIMSAWHEVAAPTQPIILHAESRVIEPALALAAGQVGHPTHVAHVSNRLELKAVMDAKSRGWPVTCGVTPHHLYLTEDEVKRQGWYARMKPPLATQEDQDFLWANLDAIDVFETDHAPHTKEEKDWADTVNPDADMAPEAVKSYGVPGLEAMLPLLLHAHKKQRLTPEQIIDKTSTRPREILGLASESGTSVRVAMEDYEFSEADVRSKCGWSPYVGRLVTGRVVQVDLRGYIAYRNGEFASPPQGSILNPISH